MKKKSNMRKGYELKDEEIFSNYQKIGNSIIRFNKMATAFFELSVLFFVLIIFGVFLVLINPINPYAILFPFIFLVFFMISFALIPIAFLMERFYREKEYDIYKITGICFKHISRTADKLKRDEYLKHLLFNIQRLRNGLKYRKKSIFLEPSTLKMLQHFYQKESEIKIKIIDEVADFVIKSLIYLEDNQIKSTFVDLGIYFENRNYPAVWNSIKDKKVSLIVKSFSLMSAPDGIKSAIKNFASIITSYYKPIFYFVVLALIILYSLGIMQSSPIPFP